MKKYFRLAVTVICVLAAGVCYSCGGVNGYRGASGERTLMLDADDSGAADGRLSDADAADKRFSDADERFADAAGGQFSDADAAPGKAGADDPADADAVSEDGRDPAFAAGAADSGAYGKEQTAEALCYVHICGEVVRPGVYELPEGSRIFEAVEKAGGFTKEAASSYLNLAQEIADGMKIVVPSEAQLAAESEDAAGSGAAYTGVYGVFPGTGEAVAAVPAADGKVNINTAGKEELMTLDGIGEARAEDIIRYREQNGPFQTIEDIMKVSGIKSAAFEKIKDDIIV